MAQSRALVGELGTLLKKKPWKERKQLLNPPRAHLETASLQANQIKGPLGMSSQAAQCDRSTTQKTTGYHRVRLYWGPGTAGIPKFPSAPTRQCLFWLQGS